MFFYCIPAPLPISIPETDQSLKYLNKNFKNLSHKFGTSIKP